MANFLTDFQTDLISEKEKTTLALRVCKEFPITNAGYIINRFEIYSNALILEQHGKITAIQFYTRFTKNQNTYFYLGPLFSRNGLYLKLFQEWFEKIITEDSDTLFMMAEFQNPEIFLVYKFLFEENSCPDFNFEKPKPYIIQALLDFESNIDHIENLQVENFSSRSSNTFFKYDSTFDPILDWMKSNGINLSSGDNQIFIVAIDKAIKHNIRIQVNEKVNFILDNPDWKETLLQNFTSKINA